LNQETTMLDAARRVVELAQAHPPAADAGASERDSR
jgi:hypothetical protein